ncbi:hypothetical protein LK07_21435 [Streptomyces pluripotens]|uniref:Integral membrane protein n=1 Tax=Streptomyces pluripotens TaxID=1355015 RepID=A0A221P1U8_9ACTN|nr:MULTISPECIES: hypothetical protein [Streptomyces]ARP71900.1 hypothetical protein LK06_020280 [Streptomyces pluripotens]ASN26147.1 hypothetical protein LK07_21435 [Streptomyces pluripotens]KIE26317.1 membrane protein [Streptomyces sp. MUSC 125]MCH0556388.1 hypothetical protein [Streptomyces sp. MUM 16J]
MPDRSPRLLTFPPRPAQGGERGVLLRERPASPPEASRGGQDGGSRGGEQQDDNPFAPPPEGTPDRPWQPRHPEGSSSAGAGSGSETGNTGGAPGPGGGSPSGSRWSDRQPGGSPDGGFGERPGSGPQSPGGSTGPGGPGGMRWDPTDPAQRRARYALLSGMWSVFFVLFGWQYVALLLGALALYWGISALRAKPRVPGSDTPASTDGRGVRPQATAAIGGLVTASLALVLVASAFTVQLVYRDYYTCVNDALTHEAKQSCEKLLPQELRGVLGAENG